jgi:hypothetical protein
MTDSLDQKKDLLCRAITEKHVVQFKYAGRSRIVEPYCCGISSAGDYVLEIIRFGGNFTNERHATQL